MRLAELNPSLHWSPHARGYTHQLQFDCQKCGPPHKILVCCAMAEPTPGVWKLTLPETVSGDGWNGVTLTPSINSATHGRKKVCGQHCSIIDGEVLP